MAIAWLGEQELTEQRWQYIVVTEGAEEELWSWVQGMGSEKPIPQEGWWIRIPGEDIQRKVEWVEANYIDNVVYIVVHDG